MSENMVIIHKIDFETFQMFNKFTPARQKQIIDIAILNAISNDLTDFKDYDKGIEDKS